MTTAAHSTQVAAAILTPCGDGFSAASQLAASRLRSLWNHTIIKMLKITKNSFTMNMPSARYCAGLVSHSVAPERNWITRETQMNGMRGRNAVNGIFGNRPYNRRAMTVMKPRIVAVPNACSVNAPAHPHDTWTHCAYSDCASCSSTTTLRDENFS